MLFRIPSFMAKIEQSSDSLENLTQGQIEELVNLNDALEKEEAKWIKEEQKEKETKARERKLAKMPFRRLRKAPLEIISRLLFWFFLVSFLFSFISVYLTSIWWFVWYVISACACIFYPPNRKTLKELLDAWPNIVDLIKRK